MGSGIWQLIFKFMKKGCGFFYGVLESATKKYQIKILYFVYSPNDGGEGSGEWAVGCPGGNDQARTHTSPHLFYLPSSPLKPIKLFFFFFYFFSCKESQL